ncbi:hypothetical protein E2C01_093187 [Portunus trituberculatus]|uniref:Uncharacterized protein n=1 Tax=Portunus trituberculatus TaxID=210409 RepID=A0A5B7JM41_PORTR|nr:hypothetical protein [Portunus trituberculatus]
MARDGPLPNASLLRKGNLFLRLARSPRSCTMTSGMARGGQLPRPSSATGGESPAGGLLMSCSLPFRPHPSRGRTSRGVAGP